MQFTTLFAAAAAFAGLAAAQDVQSKPFHLQVKSSNKTLNGQYFQSCHEGAAIESLCLGNGKAVFHLNTTKGQEPIDKTHGLAGTLTWDLKYDSGVESEPMGFYIDPGTNVALPLFEPSYDYQQVAFDRAGLMNVQVYVDDTTNPPKAGTSRALYRWYACETYYSGYTYQTLNWVYGAAKPQNPTCQKIDVKRVFA